jgi:predicted ester cyclase
VTGLYFTHVTGDRVAEHWAIEDRGAMLIQLGHAPAPPIPFFLPDAPPAAHGAVGTPEENKTVMRRILAEAFNTGDPSPLSELVAVDVVGYDPFPGEPQGIEGVAEVVSSMREIFPDYRETVMDMAAEDDLVAVRRELSGTQAAMWMGIPPTNLHGRIMGIGIFRIRGGKIVERWGQTDVFAFGEIVGRAPGLDVDG